MTFLKIMSLAGQDEIIWDMESDEELPIDHVAYIKLNKYIDLHAWNKAFNDKFMAWLELDDLTMYNIHDPINMEMIEAVIDANLINDGFKLFYWFDVNRDITLNFNWKYCPISNSRLMNLGKNFHRKNRLISSSFPLVFPQT
jgi:hypothetical protein